MRSRNLGVTLNTVVLGKPETFAGASRNTEPSKVRRNCPATFDTVSFALCGRSGTHAQTVHAIWF
jgi:hypothetical protein